jgi:hypothetical protein
MDRVSVRFGGAVHPGRYPGLAGGGVKFLLPIGGIVDSRFGILTTPGMRGIPVGIKEGMVWAGDNQAFTKEFNPSVFFEWLEMMKPYKSTCIFISCPDSVGDAVETHWLFNKWRSNFLDWPVAFVAQNGQENLDFPDSNLWDVLFVGGSTKWKLSQAATDCIKRAQALGKGIHIGRVNWRRRYNHFSELEGSKYFTCDGTRTRYGKDKALLDWKNYMESPNQLRFHLSDGDCPG